jgi:SAM-dependent methyltransferase
MTLQLPAQGVAANAADPDDEPCPVCLSRGLRDLPDPWRGRSLLSDMRTTPERLNRAACLRCGLVRRRRLPALEEQRAIFDNAYSLFSEAPTEYTCQRQAAMAAWVAEVLAGFRPASVLELGCGDGSLLEALGARLSVTDLRGVEPAPRSVAQARRRGVKVLDGFAEERFADRADFCLSVNVIEHVPRPLDFLRSMRDAVSAEGRVAVVCPDGDVPNYELLFYDHLYSFGRNALEVLCARAGLVALRAEKAPPALGPFHLVIARHARDGETPSLPVDAGGARIAAMKERYLLAWSTLQDVLQARIGEARGLVVFGNSDVAALLRVYAPAVWALADACVVDGQPANDCFLDRPLRGYGSLSAPEVIVLGVRPGSQDSVARRLAADGHRVVRWDDVVGA